MSDLRVTTEATLDARLSGEWAVRNGGGYFLISIPNIDADTRVPMGQCMAILKRNNLDYVNYQGGLVLTEDQAQKVITSLPEKAPPLFLQPGQIAATASKAKAAEPLYR
jgi:hypothetical protein